MIVRNSGTGTSSTFAGVDLIVPNGFGMEFWLALQYGTAHASALRDQKSTEFESNRFNFPSDIPDCDAGRCEVNDERDELITEDFFFMKERILIQKKYLSRPHNRRVKYWSSLRVKYPFSFEWSSLVHEWLDSTSSRQTDSKTNPSNDFYVIRDRRQLLVIDKWLSSKVPLPDDIVKQNQKALVPVRLDVLTTGRPQRFALICAPSDDDFSAIIKWNSNRETVKLEEVEPESVNKTEHEIEEEDEKEEEKEENKVGMEEGFIEVNCLKKETPISLNALFPDKAILRNQKRIAVKRLKRQKWKAAKRRRKDVVGSEKTTDESGSWQDGVQNSLNKVADFDQSENISYKESCSR
ncbi:unnamed protein product [Anisakis simplex]|uniref:Uncharacterized protein n=1 Tax=Anisakis simplex TaxID=6269 RepID=A0A3P6N4Y9_ANISI|nr:unnamed protein product [Anisakis simplex]